MRVNAHVDESTLPVAQPTAHDESWAAGLCTQHLGHVRVERCRRHALLHAKLGVAARGRSIDIETCEIYEVADTMVVTSWVYGDVLTQLLTQLSADDGEGT